MTSNVSSNYLLDLLKLIENYNPKTLSEQNSKLKTLELLKNFPDTAANRDNLPGHLTASAFVIDSETNSKTLLLLHKKLNIWLQPGGHVDGDFNLLGVALKELEEEAGVASSEIIKSHSEILDIDVHKIPEYKDMPEHYHYDCRFLIEISVSFTPCPQEDESRNITWFSFDKLPSVDDSIKRMVEKVQESRPCLKT